MSRLTTKLQNILEKLKAGKSPTMSLRQLLKAAGAERRGTRTVAEIRGALDDFGLETIPDFGDEQDLDARLAFRFRES